MFNSNFMADYFTYKYCYSVEVFTHSRQGTNFSHTRVDFSVGHAIRADDFNSKRRVEVFEYEMGSLGVQVPKTRL